MRYSLLALALLGAGLRAAPVAQPPAPPLAPAGYQLILDHEVGGGREYFERFLARPTYPGGASGITVGVGYDVRFNSPAVIRTDWAALPSPWKTRLAEWSGKQGTREGARQLRDILIEWGLAEDVFQAVTISKFWNMTRRTIGPTAWDRLHPHAQAALVSLGFNRGWSLAGPSRLEMREIVRLAPRQDYRGMAAQIRAMKRLWVGKGLDGLLRRREDEARLMESASPLPTL